ncbi:dTDP-4-dehydrorhamnose reductase [Paenibacillus chungangensis]|uniref:dTDP-4-dehydrorhamnose reductase n=1 Tax=Paenibacillus chungangensis TaxID=696535 RepID=A0ABW3HWB6_9BACL
MKKSTYKIAITGAGGMLGKELVLLASPGVTMIPLTRQELDITDAQQCMSVFQQLQPDAIIHCAAYTAVDQAEADEAEAYRINAEGTRNVAEAARQAGAKLIYISTDYVFDGTASTPYSAYSSTHPRSVYGKSKLAGERAVQATLPQHFIVRTSWVFGKHGNNFVTTMLKLAEKRDVLKVVNDQIGSPTYTHDLARFLVELARSEAYGVYQATNEGNCSWYVFAKAIFELCPDAPKVELLPCTTEEFPRPAPRPAYSVLDGHELAERGFQPLRPWREALQHYFTEG